MPDLTFKIDGHEYPTGDIGEFLGSFNIDECKIYHDWTGDYYENIGEAEVNGLMIAAFMQIAYMRQNPAVSAQAAQKLVGKSNFADALADFNAAAEDDASPPPQRQDANELTASPGNEPESKQSSGDGSTASSVTRLPVQSPSGSLPWAPSVTSGSATSAS